MEHTKGTLIVTTKGDYEEYIILDIFVIQQDFDVKNVLRKYLKAHPRQSQAESMIDPLHISIAASFIKWLKEHQYIKSLLYGEWFEMNPETIRIGKRGHDDFFGQWKEIIIK